MQETERERIQEGLPAPTGRRHLLTMPDTLGIGVEGRRYPRPGATEWALWEQPDSSSPTWVLPWQLLSLSRREGGRQEGSVCSLPCCHLLPKPASSSSASESIKATTCRKDLSGKPVCSEPGELPAKTLYKYRRRSQEIYLFIFKF